MLRSRPLSHLSSRHLPLLVTRAPNAGCRLLGLAAWRAAERNSSLVLLKAQLRRRSSVSARGELEQAGPYEEVVLEHIPDESSLKAQGQWLAAHIQLWADEEWTVLPVHEELARITAKAYMGLRHEGSDELGDILLGISSRLQTFDFQDTFTDAFEVANKVAELLMTKEGREVCCQSDDEKERYDRGEAEFAALHPNSH